MEYCNLCGKRISGQAVRLRHPRWPHDQSMLVCPDCMQQKPKCSICGLPIHESDINLLCPTCQQNSLSCIGCGQAISTRHYFTLNNQGPYCKQCRRVPPLCESCGGPLTERRWQLSDGRLFCENCFASTINDPEKAANLYQEVSLFIKANLGLSLNVPTGLVLVDLNQLATVMTDQFSDAQDPPERTLGFYTRRGVRRGIYIQTGLPLVIFQQVAAHEVAHAWQGENCPLLEDVLVREGFAEWVAYKVMEHLGNERERALMLRRADLYGQGLRWALDLEAREGMQAVLDANRRLPVEESR